ncbi:MAG: cupin domain-containing protein [Spirochaetales bacterium]|nr:cupin domain-containing protein [Spirochaetales bacterium]
MSILYDDKETPREIAPGVSRKIIHEKNILTAVIDFTGGPKDEADPPHSHPHEQITFVAEGEIFFILEGRKNRLKAGDLFSVPPDLPHTVQLLSKTARLVDSFTPVREDFL